MSSHSPSWSPDGARIAFERNGQVFVIEADGSGQRHLGPGSAPDWSPDGSRIVFVGRAIFVMDADGSNRRRLVDHPPDCFSPVWSPDGARIAFSTLAPDGSGSLKNFVNVVESDGSNLTVLCRGREPSWSPDGTRIAFVSFSDGTYNICTVGPDGSNIVQLTYNLDKKLDLREPDWSADGARVILRTNHHEIRTVRVDGSEDAIDEAVLVEHRYARQPTWSPDGTAVAFTGRETGTDEVYVVDSSGSDLRRLTGARSPEGSSAVTLTRIVYGDVSDSLVFIEAAEARADVELHTALQTARTWGEFKEMSPSGYEEVVERLIEQMVGELDEGEQLDENWEPAADSVFEPDEIPGHTDGDWPGWPARDMLGWVPEEIQLEFGSRESTPISGDYLALPPEKEREVTSAMRKHGYECVRDDDLVWKASGYG